MTLPASDITALVDGEHEDVFSVLGPHVVDLPSGRGIVVRAFLVDAESARVVPLGTGSAPRAMERLHPAGLFEAVFPDARELFPYRVEVIADGATVEIDDAYRFGSTLSDYDLHLLGEGTHENAADKLGAHPMVLDGVAGTTFAVWAPNARAVSVVGDFNRWDGRRHPMRRHPGNGIWEIFVPGAGEGVRYKFEIRSRSGEPLALKADPYAFAFEAETPRTAAIVTSLDTHRWRDAAWTSGRARRDPLHGPMSIYEVHLGSWRRVPEEGDRFLTYRELAERLGAYVRDMGFTHVELMPVMEHPFYGSWGYQVIGYFAPTRRYGTPAEFMAFVDELHRQGIGIILDWVPAHFPRDPHGLGYFDGTHLYEHADPRLREHADWGTLIFNYGRNEVANFLLGNGLFWLDRYHVDGLRVDAVASMIYLDYSRREGEWIPNEFGGRENLGALSFLRRLNEVAHRDRPGIVMAAEESTAWPMVSRPTYVGGLGFGGKWNMGWMHDVLDFMSRDPVHRKYHHDRLTFGMLYAWTENFILPLSHDEVVHGKGSLLQKMPGDDWQRFANLRALSGFMYGHPGKKLLFMGAEFGQSREWHHDRSLDWHLLDAGPYHRGMQELVRDLNRLHRTEPALHELDFDPAGFAWIDCSDWEQSVVSFVRRGREPEDVVVVACNFTPVPRFGYRVGVPGPAYYHELLNTDAAVYGGSNVGNEGGAWSTGTPWQGQPDSILVTLPPLGVLFLKPA
ncbi:MAG: 1,4-alpha-glucan branching protein GlgB [Candidatus Rokubacteria bacterium]|nr:1,4-alpha-glucan branching protein GlgB [Candidatus Rokubacteria bacterium]